MAQAPFFQPMKSPLGFGVVSNSNSLSNQLGIHIILAKQEKLAFNSLAS
jgi:hypothetical protein